MPKAAFAATLVIALLPAACLGGDQPSERGPVRAGGESSRLSPDASYTPPVIESVTEPPEDWFSAACALPPSYVQRIRRGHTPGRSPEVMLVAREPSFIGNPVATSHSGPWDYLQDVPLVLYGPGFVRARGEVTLQREPTVADIAPTLAELVGYEWPRSVPGKPLTEALVPRKRREAPPKLVVVVVWDGGGWNVLDTWPGTWPVLERLAAEGTSFADAIVGSSPSVTPSVHTTIGTGAFPNRHGIPGIYLRDDAGDIVGSFPAKSGRFIDVPTLADEYDVATGNRAEIGMVAFRPWHLGMIGRGAEHPGGDRDVGVLIGLEEQLHTNEAFYEVPSYLEDLEGLDEDIRTVDLSDGRRDGKWMGHDLRDDPRLRRDTPVWILYQTRMLKALIERGGFGADEVPDLLYTNYKQIDEAGHSWNMLNVEMPEEIRFSDAALGDLVEFLDQSVGRKQWVVVVTADHGQTPAPEVSGGWAISPIELTKDLAADLGVKPGELIEKTSPVGIYLNDATMRSNGITYEDVSELALRYRLRDNVPDGDDIPEPYEGRGDELVIAAAFPSDEIDRVWDCARKESE